MKHVLAAFILCSLLAVAQAPDVLTTDAVIKMVQSGVPNQTIIRTIQSAAQVNFTFLPDDLELMIRAKVPEDVFKAMAAKSAGRPAPGVRSLAETASGQPSPPATPVRPDRTRRQDRTDRDHDYPRVELFAGYSMFKPEVPNDILGGNNKITIDGQHFTANGDDVKNVAQFLLGNVLGWGASGSFNFTRVFGVTGDVSGHYRSLGDIRSGNDVASADANIHTFLGGPKFTWRTGRTSTFAEALFGVGRISASAQVNASHANYEEHGFAGAIGGGLDVNISRRFAARLIEVDYFPYRSKGEFFFNNVRWRSGLVLRF
jgi:hypothetical protein